MKTVLIGTMAINRLELHTNTIPNWYNYIDKIDENIKITKQNFQNIITNVPLTFIKKENNNGNFLNACRNIALSMEQYVNDK